METTTTPPVETTTTTTPPVETTTTTTPPVETTTTTPPASAMARAGNRLADVVSRIGNDSDLERAEDILRNAQRVIRAASRMTSAQRMLSKLLDE